MNIAVQEELLSYLRERAVFPGAGDPDIIYYPGGVSGVVALATDGTRHVIVKQALSRLKVKDVWECDPQRIITEHRAHEAYARLVPQCVPQPLFADDTNKIIGREGVPDGTPMWKSLLLDGLLDFRVAEKVIDALAVIHDESSRDAALRADFADTDIFYELRISPYIEKTVSVHPRLRERSLPVVKRLLEEKIVLNHGDFSPKNILIDNRNVYILDYEVAHCGHPSFDLAFFFNHFILKSVKNGQWRSAYLNMFLHMAHRYLSRVSFMNPETLEHQTMELLGFLLLARVDGKSPAEYIQSDADKNAVRSAAFAILDNGAATFADVPEIIGKATQP